MKKEDAKKLAFAIACEMIGCNGDCDNCDKDNVERRRQDIINKLNDKAADGLKFAKSFKETTLAEQRELIFEKGKHFDVLERVLAIHDVLELARDIELGSLKNLLDAFNIYRKLIKNWNDNINHIVEDDLKVLDKISNSTDFLTYILLCCAKQFRNFNSVILFIGVQSYKF